MSLRQRISAFQEPAGTLKWAWSELRGARALTVASMAGVAGSSGSVVATPVLLKWLIDSLLPQKQWINSGFAALLWGVSLVGRVVFDSLAEYCKQCAIQKSEFLVRTRRFAHVCKLPAANHDGHAPGDLNYRLDDNVAQFARSTIGLAIDTARFACLTCMTMAVVLSIVSWKLAAVLAPAAVLFVALQFRRSRALRECVDRAVARRADLSAFLQESLSAILQIQILRRERSWATRAARHSGEAARAAIRSKRNEILLSATSMMAWALGVITAVAYGVWQVRLGVLSVGGLVSVYWLVYRVFEPLNQIGGVLTQWRSVRASGVRIREVMDAAPLNWRITPSSPSPRNGGGPIIQYREVVFSYSQRSRTALCGVSLDVQEGERVAIVGPSGSGKSTLAKLLVRLYDPDGGDIYVCGRNVREYDPHELRSIVGLVPQDFALFRGTVQENLLDGNAAARLWELASTLQTAQLLEELDQMPGRFDYSLGASGSGLSTGQRQRLAIARELLASRRILIFDESTSALDASTEHRLLEALTEHLTNQTVIMISHRPAPARWASRLIQLKEGRIVNHYSDDGVSGMKTALGR